MNKALTLIVILSAIISTQPVFAVDYVACREMLRTKNEMLINADEAVGNFYKSIAEQSCPEDKFIIHKIQYGVDFKDKDYDAHSKCIQEAHSSYEQTHKPLLALENGVLLPYRGITNNFYSPTAVNWIKASKKVSLDMKKASCPYE